MTTTKNNWNNIYHDLDTLNWSEKKMLWHNSWHFVGTTAKVLQIDLQKEVGLEMFKVSLSQALAFSEGKGHYGSFEVW